MSISLEQEQALLICAKAALVANGTTKPTVRHIVKVVEEAAKFLGLSDITGVYPSDKVIRHIIAEGELKKEFDHV